MITLIAVSIGIGWLLERGYSHLAAHITTWLRLLALLGLLYLGIVASLLYLSSYTLKIDGHKIRSMKDVCANERGEQKKFRSQFCKLSVFYSLRVATQRRQSDDCRQPGALARHVQKQAHTRRVDRPRMFSFSFLSPFAHLRKICILQSGHLVGLVWQQATCPDRDPRSLPTNFPLEEKIGFGSVYEGNQKVFGITSSCVDKVRFHTAGFYLKGAFVGQWNQKYCYNRQ